MRRSAWSLDPKSRTLRTEIDLKNPGERLRPGMYAYAVLTVEHADVWTVPAAALVTQGEQAFCYLVEDGKAVRTPSGSASATGNSPRSSRSGPPAARASGRT